MFNMKNKKDFLILTLSVIIVLFVINFLSSRHFVRIDLTEDKEFTLSKATKNILENLDDVVNVRLYFSKDLPPALTMLKRDVDDMLEEYKTYGGSKLNIQYVDPQESPQKEQQVAMMGIPPVQLNVIAKDKQELVKVYLGMAVIHEDRKEIIPVIQRTGTLEYELTSAILKVSTKEAQRIAWLTSEEGTSYKNIQELLKRRYEIRELKSGSLDLDSKKDAMLILAVENDLTETDLFEVDQYLMKGGKILLMIDRIKVGNNLQTTMLEAPNVLAWLKNQNIEVKDKLVRDRSNTHAAFSGGYVTYHVPYPFWVRVAPDGFNPDSPIVSDLETLIFPWVSPLEIDGEKSEDVDIQVLAETSLYNNVVDLGASLMPNDAQKAMKIDETDPKPLVIFATGKLNSFYGEGRREAPVGGTEIVGNAENGHLMVIGNSRFIQDNFLQQFKVNHIFFENSVDFMAMGSELIGIRSKGATNRPVEELSPAGLAAVKYVNILGMPIILIVLGFIIYLMRRQRRQVLRNIYK